MTARRGAGKRGCPATKATCSPATPPAVGQLREGAAHRQGHVPVAGDVDVRMPGAESGAEVYARYDAVIDEIALSGVGTAVVISHGAVIRSWAAARAHNVTAGFAARSPLTNTGAVLLDGSPRDGWHALAWDGRLLRGPEVDVPGDNGLSRRQVSVPR
ncbi:MAG TPA: histidine phosphatase family protein [Candidatus Limnocylindrales bacterium]